ncbi:MAG TPA: bifunctional phosphopantothenoylcysteine decarboxylase/phosphopantothenate--cysteine ligase CoaBC [Candidatus Dormibacteraeota bacterium]|nr:bifunctional phosphopantothenoylcysteine decarboxylase/phosphopantothenate--cysteine ligase CoaBC [Candidatus Dormibacteraeota bacterium]
MAPTPADLAGRRVVLYIGGSIAAYKAGEIVTLLRRRGAEVRVAMTEAAARFVGPVTFQSLSGHAVAADPWEPGEGGVAVHGMAHLGLGGWAEAQVAAPASADLLARLALGLAGDAVTATALACTAPLLVAPAMETRMWEHPATQAHMATLRGRGAVVVGPQAGRLASGAEGMGRMAEPAEVVEAIARVLTSGAGPAELAGRRLLITSGGTREPVDPVRYLGNRSSGRMGGALAVEALGLGAEVTLITTLPPPSPHPRLQVVPVSTAAEMLAAVRAHLAAADVLVMAAAVADYRPAQPSERKLKKTDAPLHLELVPTEDILHAVRDQAREHGVMVVGFAAETDDLLDNARSKLERKGLELIVANDVATGMGGEENAVTILGREGVVAEVTRAPKAEVARQVLRVIAARR